MCCVCCVPFLNLSVQSQEALVLQQLKHPNIIDFLGIFFNPPSLGIVIEYCTNGSLYDALKTRKLPQPPLKIALGIALGMEVGDRNSHACM